MADTPIDNALKRRQKLQEEIRAALEGIAEVEKYLQMHRKYALQMDTPSNEPIAGETFGRAGKGQAQEVFESFLVATLRDLGRPLQSGEVVEEFRKRGHPIGGTNELKQAWNRLWEAKTRNILVHLPPYGYWLANEPIPESTEISEIPKKRKRHAPRVSSPPGRVRILTPEVMKKVHEMMAEGQTVVAIAKTLGGLSPAAIHRHLAVEQADKSKEETPKSVS